MKILVFLAHFTLSDGPCPPHMTPGLFLPQSLLYHCIVLLLLVVFMLTWCTEYKFYLDIRGDNVMVIAPRAGSGVVRIDPLHFLAGCRRRRLNQV